MKRPKNLGGLGFRNLENFNLALLSRQAWWILNDPASLSARILQVKYFPSSSFLEAELGPNPSEIWRAMIAGRDILHQSSKIGDGETTQIWRDNWISKDRMMRLLAPRTANPPIANVPAYRRLDGFLEGRAGARNLRAIRCRSNLENTYLHPVCFGLLGLGRRSEGSLFRSVSI